MKYLNLSAKLNIVSGLIPENDNTVEDSAIETENAIAEDA